MFGVKSIVYQHNKENFIITIDEKCTIQYLNITKEVEKKLILDYLDVFFRIISEWDNEYIDLETIDGNEWSLTITFENDEKEVFSGKAKYPKNFEAYERLNKKLIKEALYV